MSKPERKKFEKRRELNTIQLLDRYIHKVSEKSVDFAYAMKFNLLENPHGYRSINCYAKGTDASANANLVQQSYTHTADCIRLRKKVM